VLYIVCDIFVFIVVREVFVACAYNVWCVFFVICGFVVYFVVCVVCVCFVCVCVCV